MGTLTVDEEHIEFVGRRHHVSIYSINELTFGAQGRDFINNCVHIDSGDQTVFSPPHGAGLGLGVGHDGGDHAV
jgi:hypothetical protein